MPNLAVDVDSWARSACYPRSTFYPLSDGPPTRGRRITRACFRTCSACGPRSQARLYSCIQKDGCRPSRADLRAPPLPFRRRPPQSNCPPGTVPEPVDGLGLGRRSREGSIPRAAPRGLAPPDRCLLPILYTRDQRPMPSCSEGSRGLSVLPRVSRIFTTSAISPGPWSRQRPSRCAFRAGRNLPDKEFRYLRTVIVTAAVYRGGPPPLPGRAGSRTRGHPFSRSYGAIVPSSLTMVDPIASVCSTHPPVSVCGTGAHAPA